MNNCQKCRPCCGGHHGKRCEDVEVIVHKTVHCYEPHRHHHKCVRHIVPVVHHQHHHHHKHHEYEIKRKHHQHHRHHEHGKVQKDFCKIDGCECRKEKEHHGHHGHHDKHENHGHHGHHDKHENHGHHDKHENYGRSEGEKFEQFDFGNEFANGSEMFM